MKVFTSHVMVSSNDEDAGWVVEVVVDRSVLPDGTVVPMRVSNYPPMQATVCLSDGAGAINTSACVAALPCVNNFQVAPERVHSSNLSAPYRLRPGGFFQCRFPPQLRQAAYERWDKNRRRRLAWEHSLAGLRHVGAKARWDSASDGLFRARAVAYLRLHVIDSDGEQLEELYATAPLPVCGFGGVVADGYKHDEVGRGRSMAPPPSSWRSSPHIVRRHTLFDVLSAAAPDGGGKIQALKSDESLRRFIKPMDADAGVRLGPALCLVTFDNDSFVLPEFIEYYRTLGVERFIVYDRTVPPTDTVAEVLAEYAAEGLVSFVSWPFAPFRESVERRGEVWMRHSTYVQHTAIDVCLNAHTQRFQYVTTCDADEFYQFLRIPQRDALRTIASALQAQFERDDAPAFAMLARHEQDDAKKDGQLVNSVGFCEKLCAVCAQVKGLQHDVGIEDRYALGEDSNSEPPSPLGNDTLRRALGNGTRAPAVHYLLTVDHMCCVSSCIPFRRKLLMKRSLVNQVTIHYLRVATALTRAHELLASRDEVFMRHARYGHVQYEGTARFVLQPPAETAELVARRTVQYRRRNIDERQLAFTWDRFVNRGFIKHL